jgi:hypothetical protein
MRIAIVLRQKAREKEQRKLAVLNARIFMKRACQSKEAFILKREDKLPRTGDVVCGPS